MVKAKISDYLIGVVVFTIFIVGGVSMLSIFHSHDSSFGGSRYAAFNSSFNKLDTINSTIGGLSSQLSSSDKQDFGAFGVLNSLISKGWQSLRMIGTSFSFMNGVFAASASMFGLPSFVVVIVELLIGIVLIFAIWGAIFQRDL